MDAATTTGSWNRRPGLTTARLFGWSCGLLTVLAGFVLSLETGRPWWWLGLTVLAIWVWLKGAPLLLGRLERLGTFGRVRMDGGRLRTGRAGSDVDLDEPFEVDGRLQQVLLSHEFEMRDVLRPGSTRGAGLHTRTQQRAVSVLAASICQDGETFHLVADETTAPPLADYGLGGTSARKMPLARVSGRVVRLYPGDLVEILRRLRSARGFAVPPDAPADRIAEDPRRIVWPRRTLALGAVVVSAACLALGFFCFDRSQEAAWARQAELRTRAKAEGEAREARARALIGKRVRIPARKGVKLYGTVTKVVMKEHAGYAPDYHLEWKAELTVSIDALHDEDDRPMAADAEAPFRHDGDRVRVGRLLEVYLSQVEPVDGDTGAGAEAPDGG